MDDGGTDVPVAGGLWRQSLARVTGAPPRDRDVEIQKHIEKSRIRFGKEPRRTPIEPIR